MKKLVSTLLAVALVLSVLAMPALAEQQDVLELSMWAFGFNANYTGNVQENIIQDYAAEKFGVKITSVISTESLDQNEKFNLLYAAKQVPDILIVPNWYAPFLTSMDEADMCYRFSDETIREYLPDVYARIPEITWAIWKRASGTVYDETMYIPMGQFSANAYTRAEYPDFTDTSTSVNSCNMWGMRDDIFQAMYPDAPSYEELMAKIESGEALSYDDLYVEGLSSYEKVIEALKQIHEQFPDVTTVDSIDASSWSRAFLGGTWYAQFDPTTMEVFSIATDKTEEFNAMMADLNGLYNAGAIEPDFAILKKEQKTEYINSGAYAVVTSNTSYGTGNAALIQSGSEYRYRPILVAYETNEGEGVWDGYGMLETGRCPIAWAINKTTVAEEDLPRILNYINYFFTDEGLAMLAWGPEDSGLWQWVDGERQWVDPEFAAVVAGEKPVGQMKDYDYYGLNAVGTREAHQPIFPRLFFGGTNPYVYSSNNVSLSSAVATAMDAHNEGYWDNAYSAWNTTSATNNDFWQYWSDMGDACKKAIVAADEETFNAELDGFYAIIDKVNMENYLQDQSGYAEYCKSYSEGFSFHPEFVAAHPEYAK